MPARGSRVVWTDLDRNPGPCKMTKLAVPPHPPHGTRAAHPPFLPITPRPPGGRAIRCPAVAGAQGGAEEIDWRSGHSSTSIITSFAVPRERDRNVGHSVRGQKPARPPRPAPGSRPARAGARL